MVTTNLLEAFTELGMSEFDAWRCVHVMQGRASLVLVQVRPAGEAADLGDPSSIDVDEVNAALSQGASWARIDSGGWQYLRKLQWGLGDVAELHADLMALSEMACDDGPTASPVHEADAGG
jgi:hypothetical protein